MSDKQLHWQLPAVPDPHHSEGIHIFDLGQMVGKTGWGSARLIDIKPGVTATLNLPNNCLLEVIEGRAVVNGQRLKRRMYGQFPAGELIICNPGRSRMVRLMVVSTDNDQMPERIKPKIWSILKTQIKDRPKGIRLRSLWEKTDLKQDAGYEWVRIRGLVARHNHRAKDSKETGSFALVLVVSGEGQFGFAADNGEGQVATIGAGSVVIAGPNDWHGFLVAPGKQLTIVSIQIDAPIGEELYEFASELGIPEFPYE